MLNFLYRGRKNRNRKKLKYSFSLIEIVIAFALLAVLIYALLSGFSALSLQNLNFQKSQKEVMDRARLHLRLIQIFEAMNLETKTASSFHLGFFQGSKSSALFFTFYPIDSNPKFSVPLNSTLFLDLKKRLHLICRSDAGDEREEILIEGIEQVDFEFFDVEEKLWKKEWPKNRAEIPLMLRIKLVTSASKDPLTYLFAINKNAPLIKYKLVK